MQIGSEYIDPQIVIHKLAHNQISREEADRQLALFYEKAYEDPIWRIIKDLFRSILESRGWRF